MKRLVLFLLILCCYCHNSLGQEEYKDSPEMAKFRKWTAKNYKISKAMRRARLDGEVCVGFTVDTMGRLTDFEIVKDMGFGTGEELVRVLELSNTKYGRWKPGIKDRKKVPVRLEMPVFIYTK